MQSQYITQNQLDFAWRQAVVGVDAQVRGAALLFSHGLFTQYPQHFEKFTLTD